MAREAKWVGWFVLVLGCTAILAGAGLLAGGATPGEGLSCKALCGLTLLAVEILGPWVGARVGGLLWLAAGAVFCSFGYRLLKA